MVELLSCSPLIALVKGALDEQACEALVALGTRSMDTSEAANTTQTKRRAALLCPQQEAEHAALTHLDTCVMDLIGAELRPWVVHSTSPDAASQPRDMHLGLHVDTLHAPRRFVTALLYLTDVARGGQTVFPLAVDPNSRNPWSCVSDARAVSAAQVLLDRGIEHTSLMSRAFPRGDTAAKALDLLEARGMDPRCGVAAQPIAGDLLLFFTRGDEGCVDARSWHGGAAVTQGSKWTLQNFMEIPSDTLLPDAADYINARRQQLIDQLRSQQWKGAGSS